MGRLIFLLSGEHPTLPASEVLASIEAEGYDCRVKEKIDQGLVVRTEADPKSLSKRIAMTHWIGEHFCTSRLDEVLDAVGSTDLIDFLPHGESIAVRVRRIKQYSPEVDVIKLAKDIADQLLEEVKFQVDLTNPDNEIVCVLTEDLCALGVVKAKVDRSQFEERRPKRRTAIHPATLQPRFARVLVNLARTPREGSLLDPFCGIGGILLEAGLIGAKPIGMDIKPDLIEGAKENLKWAGVDEFELQVGDARELSIGKVDAIATDPPYGRQASTGDLELKEVYEEVLPVLSRTLKGGRYLCICAPQELDLKELASGLKLSLEEKHKQRVHKDLTRNIYVFRRKKD
ncbi:hypothetical protein AKJ45_00095 [candidate division MSBL1 archaeon SCGC-AAA261F19]|uniref:tRNA (guanine(10)-N(2))-dimethyltransferase n=2 Tax=candidate division MSBL1 TaxID=215777 RepID=A0A133VBR0_9EURY|nr:hypothetical protein AKJ43_01980 [candidate division MSBL1 archaeon SCGC-AAA261D19]KXB03891.1 hypothetical protein AKJ45_00095 [candidate division MSBL1 archaeon SCGC-AAA261F19]